MASRHKESLAGKEKSDGVSPMSTSTPTERRRSLRPSTPPGTTAAKDHGKAPATTSSTGEPRKHVPNYLKPTISSNPDAAKHTAAKKHAHNDTHKPTPTMMRRRSFDRPVPSSQVQRAVQSSSARGERTTPPFSPKHSAAGMRPASSSSDRISKVVKVVKSQPPFLKTKSMPRTSSSSGAKKEVKNSSSKKATPSKEEEPVHAPKSIESEAEDQESLDLNVEEELAKMESPVDFPPEKRFAENKEHIDEENHSPKEYVDENKETHDSVDTTVTEDHQDEQEHAHTREPVAENTENVEVAHEEIQAVHESQDTDERDQQNSQAVNEAPAEDGDTKEDEKEKETIEEIMPVGLTVRTTPDEKDEEAAEEEQGQHDSEGGDERQNSKETVHKIDEEEKPPKSEEPVHKIDEEEKPPKSEEPVNKIDEEEKPPKSEEPVHKIDEEEKPPKSEEPVHKIDEEEKPAKSETGNVVHKRQVGGPRNKKESPAYNDVIEETASKLVEKRVNKVRALAGAFETVISLQQPDSS